MKGNFFINFQSRIHKSVLVKETLLFFAAYVVVGYAGVVAVVLLSKGAWFVLGVALTALVLRYTLSEFIHRLAKRQRPYQFYGFTPPQSRLFTTKHLQADSFPSDHEFILTFLAITALLVSTPVAWLGLFLTPFVGFARVALGYHYATDCMAGVVLGVLCGFVFILIINSTLFT